MSELMRLFDLKSHLAADAPLTNALTRVSFRLTIAVLAGCGAIALGAFQLLPDRQGDLPNSAVLTLDRGRTIALHVLQTPELQRQGLRDRGPLGPDEGLLLPVQGDRRPVVWMHGVSQPLDVVFLDGDRVAAVIRSLPPCEVAPCPTYGLSEPVEAVVELPAGAADRYGLDRGDLAIVEAVVGSRPFQLSCAAVMGLLPPAHP